MPTHRTLALVGIVTNLGFLVFLTGILDVLLSLPEIAPGVMPFMLMVTGLTIINVYLLVLSYKGLTIGEWKEAAREFVQEEARFPRVIEGELAETR